MSGYIELIFVYIVFSFGGTLIKLSRQMCGPETISFLRFFIGALVVFLIMRRRGKKVTLRLPWKWILIGAGFKSLHYFCENYGISRGLSYGSIIINPATTVLIVLSSLLLFHEKFTGRTVLSIFLCMAGVLLISWNGMSDADGADLTVTAVLLLAAVGQAGFSVVQKKLLTLTDPYNGMLAMFALSALFLFFPAACSGTVYTGFHGGALFGLISLGIITGVTFLMISDALKTVPLHVSTLLQSITTVFSVLWGILFWGESVTVFTVIGTLLSFAGIVLLKNRKKEG